MEGVLENCVEGECMQKFGTLWHNSLEQKDTTCLVLKYYQYYIIIMMQENCAKR